MDWTWTRRQDRFVYEMIDPNSLSSSRGFLDGVIESTITDGYYTDTRQSGTLRLQSKTKPYTENSLIRIHHYVDASNYHKELFTGYVSNIEEGWHHNSYDMKFELKSMLWRLQDDVLTNNLTLTKNSYSKEALKRVFNMCGASYSIATDVQNKKYTSPIVYEAGTSLLSTAFKICDSMNARLDVNGHGTIVVKNYVAPSSKTASATVYDDMIAGNITKTDNLYSSPNRALIVYSEEKNKTKVTKTKYADLSSSSPMAFSRRGRRVVEVHQVSDSSEYNSANADKYLKMNSRVITYEMPMLYFPVASGDVYNIRFANADHKCMLQTRDMKLRQTISCNDVWRTV